MLKFNFSITKIVDLSIFEAFSCNKINLQEKTEKELDVPLEEYESVTNTIKKTNKSHKSQIFIN